MPTYDRIIVEKNVPATMRDGTILRANVYRPAAGGPFPVALTRLPYGKEFALATVVLDPVRLAGAGYIVVIQDVRGRYASDGDWRPFEREFDDGYDTVEWAARLPDADGQVAMWGLSYFGMTQWQAAVTQPPALCALTPAITWGEYRNGTIFRGGAREWGLGLSWPQTALAADSLLRAYGSDPAALMQQVGALVGQIDKIPETYAHLPLTDSADPSGVTGFAADWLRTLPHDPFWDTLRIDGRYDEIVLPTLHLGGWYDCFIGETIRQYVAMRERAEAEGRRTPRLIVGPWTHGSFANVVGEVDFGLASNGALRGGRGDLTTLHQRWFDATLKGDESGLATEPPVQLFVMGENRWRAFDSWPVPGAREERWFLASGGHANTRYGDGTLGRTPVAGADVDSFVYDPAAPVPTRGGATLLHPVIPRGAVDQGPNEDRPDLLCYTSAPFAAPYTIIGAVSVTLFAASSAPDTDFVARLVDVHPDGRAIGVADGIIRASARESYPAAGAFAFTAPTPIEPGRIYAYTIDLWATAITFLPGHRLRVEITSSSFPRWDRNLNTGDDSATSTAMAVAHQRILHDADHPSSLTVWHVAD
ncbi:MAG TPA: CocE/NonD family hydrolase [Thermomicrobiales bacterium]